MPKTGIHKPIKLSGSEEVMLFMANCTHPLKEALVEVREIILSAHKGITEHIKWNAPSFCFQGDDRITFNVSKKDFIMLIFHRGAKVKDNKGKEPLLQDTTGLLEWLAQDRGVVKLHSLEDVTKNKIKLKRLVKQWIAATTE